MHHAPVGIWVRAYCVRNVQIDPKALAEGIAARLPGVAKRMPGTPRLNVAAALRHMRIEPAGEPGREAWLVHYGDGPEERLHLELWGRKAAKEQAGELLEELRGRDESGARRVREVLSRAVEAVVLQVKAAEVSTRLPVAIAAAAWVAEHGNGLVEADGYGWTAPTPDGVETVLEE
ncbi:MAG: hypothetical protein HYZ28_08140 [Myxococcales bacterium]|nr:hypothetical protein [Myxococcales bacterium]